MRRKLLTWLCALLPALPVVAADFDRRNDNDDRIYYNIISPTTVEVAAGAASDSYTYLFIPDIVTYNGNEYTVTNIASDALRGQSRMTKLELGANISVIGENAFANCPLLTEFSLNGNTAFAVESGLLYNADRTTLIAYPPCLNVITLPTSVTAFGSYSITDYSYNEWSKKKSMTIPGTITSIESKAFGHCPNLTSLTVLASNPASITLGDEVFYGIDKNACTLTVPSGSLALYQAADQWKDFFNIVEAEPEYTTVGLVYTSVTGGYSVTGFTSFLPSRVNIPPTYNGKPVIQIGNNAFKNCSGLTELTIPNSVTAVGNGVFNGCSSLKVVVFEDGKSSLSLKCNTEGYRSWIEGKGLFYDCPLEKVHLGRTISYNTDLQYGYSPFYNKMSLIYLTIGDSVTSIGDYAFYRCSSLTELTIPNSVTSIGNCVFNGCTSLKEIVFKDGDGSLSLGYNYNSGSSSTLGKALFYDCPLEKVHLGRNISYNSERAYGFSPFYKKDLTVLTIGNSVTSIGDYAFNGCSELTQLTIPNSVTSIGTYAFNGCSGLTKLTVPGSVTSFGNYAFKDCSGLTELTISDGVTSIGASAFNGCSGLTELTIPNSVTSIGKSAFQGCSGLSELTIPDAVTTIGDYAFQGCSGLSELTIPDAVTSIGNYAFQGCSGLTDVVIGSGVETIGDNAFNGCNNLIGVVIGGTVTSVNNNAWTGSSPVFQFLSETPGQYGYNGNVITVPHNAVEAYKAAWPEYMNNILDVDCPKNYVIETTARQDESDIVKKVLATAQLWDRNLTDAMLFVTDLKIKGTINSYDIMVLHNKALNLKHLDLSEADIVANSYLYYDSGTTQLSSKNNIIGKFFLLNMTKLVSVKLPNSAVTIDGYAVSGCLNLKEITIGDQTTTLEGGAFSSCRAERVIIGDNTQTIGSGAFYGCPNLKELVMGEKVVRIGGSAFENCNKLENMTIPASTLNIGNSAFKDCTSLVNIDISDDAALTIGEYAFYACTGLQDLNTGASTKSIGKSAFKGCTGLRDLTIGDPTVVETYAFNGCSGLRNVTVGASAQIGQQAFEGTSLVSLTVGDNARIGNKAFYQCKSLSDVVLGRAVTLDSYAFAESTVKTLTMGDDVNMASYAFQKCYKLTEVTLPANLKTASGYVFDQCIALKTVHFPPGLETVQSYAFNGCSALEAAILPMGLTTIQSNAFAGCTSLTEVKIPSSIKTIQNYAFYVGSIKDVYTWTIEPTNILQQTFSDPSYKTAMLHVPATANKLYYYDTQWSQFVNITNFDDPYEYFYLTNKDLLIYDDVERLKGTYDPATNTWTYPSADLGAGSAIVVKGEEPQFLGNVRIVYDGTKSTSIIGGNASNNGDANLNIDNLVVEMAITKGKWYFFSFPFDLDLDQMSFDGQYVWRWYDSEKRAREGGGGWTTVAENGNDEPELKAMQGYIFQGSVNGTLVINVGETHLNGLDMGPSIYSYDADNLAHANWNLVGNPKIGYYEVTDLGLDAPVTVYDSSKNSYRAVHPRDDEYQFHPFEGFFVQKPLSQDSETGPAVIVYDHDCYETYNQSIDPNFRHRAAQRRARRVEDCTEERMLVNLELSADSLIDRTRVVFNDEKTMDYDMGADAAKFMSDAAAQIYTLDASGNRCAINERPLADGTVRLGFFAPAGGKFTISASRQDIDMEIYDVKTGDSALLTAGYTFTAGKGTDNDRFILRLPHDPSGIEDIENEMQGADAEYYGVDGINYGHDSRRGVMIKKQGSSSRKVYNR